MFKKQKTKQKLHDKNSRWPTESTATTKMKQFADDTTLTLKDEKDIKLTLETVENFEKYSGLKLNKGKSTGTWLGSKQEQSGNESGIPMKKG